jgi:hypothetical protein
MSESAVSTSACGVRSSTLRTPPSTSAATSGVAATRPYQLYLPLIGSKCPRSLTSTGIVVVPSISSADPS